MIVFDFMHWLGMSVVVPCSLWNWPPPLMNVRCRYSKTAWVCEVIWEVIEIPIQYLLPIPYFIPIPYLIPNRYLTPNRYLILIRDIIPIQYLMPIWHFIMIRYSSFIYSQSRRSIQIITASRHNTKTIHVDLLCLRSEVMSHETSLYQKECGMVHMGPMWLVSTSHDSGAMPA